LAPTLRPHIDTALLCDHIKRFIDYSDIIALHALLQPSRRGKFSRA
jgi:muramoyltetrapeptide carboxypeptidase LdcA involved in peptidoglycan recycling